MCGAAVPQAPVLTAPASSAGSSITAAMGGALGVQQPTVCAESAAMFPLRMHKPGDLIFFEKTYNTVGASHVGIYVGNGMMIHCGDPISYTSINSTYWQSHFLGFGRIN